jgi:hypothetical protein
MGCPTAREDAETRLVAADTAASVPRRTLAAGLRRQENDVQDPEDELKEDSDFLLGQVADLHRLESQKRREPISSPRFHELADAVAAKAREIMYRARRGERAGDGLNAMARTDDRPPPSGASGGSREPP